MWQKVDKVDKAYMSKMLMVNNTHMQTRYTIALLDGITFHGCECEKSGQSMIGVRD